MEYDNDYFAGSLLSESYDLMNESNKKKKRKSSEADVTAASDTLNPDEPTPKKKHKKNKYKPDDDTPAETVNNVVISYEDELPEKHKKKKKHKSEKLTENAVMDSITLDDTGLTSGAEVENEVTWKKKSKKKKKKGERVVGLTEETLHTSTFLSDVAALRNDEAGSLLSESYDLMNESKKKKKRKSSEADVTAASDTLNPDEPTPKEKHKKNKYKPDDDTPAGTVNNVVISYEDELPERHKKKKKHKSEKLTENAVMDSITLDDTGLTSGAEVENEVTCEKESKKKEKKEERVVGLTEETLHTSTFLSDVAALRNDEGRPEGTPERPRHSLGQFPVNFGRANERRLVLDEASKKALEECVFNGSVTLNHLPEDPICPYCHKVYKKNTYRNEHVKAVHLKLRPFECNVCHEAFNDSTTLRVHKRIHNEEINYPCNMCEKAFRNTSNLKRHQRAHFKTASEHSQDDAELVKRRITEMKKSTNKSTEIKEEELEG